MAPTLLNAFLAAAIAGAVSVRAESHTIKFNNQSVSSLLFIASASQLMMLLPM